MKRGRRPAGLMLVSVTILALASPAVERAGHAAEAGRAAPGVEPGPRMTVSGKLLLSEGFSGGSLPAGWQPGGRAHSFRVVDGALEGTADPSDGHGPSVGVPIEARNLTVGFSMKFTRPGFFLALIDGESKFGGSAHLFRVAIGRGSVTAQQDRGSPQSKVDQHEEQQRAVKEGHKPAPPTREQLADPKFYRVEPLATRPLKSDDGQWHRVLVELHENEAVVQVDGTTTLLATGTVLDARKSRLVFLVGQGGQVLIDDVKVTESSLRPGWNEARQELSKTQPPPR